MMCDHIRIKNGTITGDKEGCVSTYPTRHVDERKDSLDKDELLDEKEDANTQPMYQTYIVLQT